MSPFCWVTVAEVWLCSRLLFAAVCPSGCLSSLGRLGLALLRPVHSFWLKSAWVRFCSLHLKT